MKPSSPMIKIRDEDSDDDLFPLSDAPNIKPRDSEYTIVEFKPKHRGNLTVVEQITNATAVKMPVYGSFLST